MAAIEETCVNHNGKSNDMGRFNSSMGSVNEAFGATQNANKGASLRSWRRLDISDRLTSLLRPTTPFTGLSDWSIAADLALVLAEFVLQRKPRRIVELGSGLSSIVLGYALARVGCGKLITIEHDESFANRTVSWLGEHGLEAFVSVHWLTLQTTVLNGVPCLWYRDDSFDSVIGGEIDMLFVDGPPGGTQKLARLPTVPKLHKYFGRDIAIILDDVRRVDELTIAKAWMKDLPEFDCEFRETVRGTAILMRHLAEA